MFAMNPKEKGTELPISDPIKFRDYLIFSKRMRDMNTKSLPHKEARKTMQKKSWLYDFEVDTIEREINLDNLRAQVSKIKPDEDKSSLLSNQFVKIENLFRQSIPYKMNALRSLRYNPIEAKRLSRSSPFYYDSSNNLSMSSGWNPQSSAGQEEEVDYKDLIVSVSVFYGYTVNELDAELRIGRVPQATDRIELTGDHTFKDLQNSISCPVDFLSYSFKDPPPDSIFFVDSSDENSNLKGSLPESLKLGDLTARLGQPYVFIHQNGCEHIIMFNDLSLHDEMHNNAIFPRYHIQKNFAKIDCSCCHNEIATKAIFDSQLSLPTSNVCDDCYNIHFFDEKGSKLYDFKDFSLLKLKNTDEF